MAGGMAGGQTSKGHVFFPGDHLLEGILEWPAAPDAGADGEFLESTAAVGGPGGHEEDHPPVPLGGVVVAHPHPLHGGTMAQPVVYRVAKAATQSGLASLRFNFRGVGRSRGSYSGFEEHRDVEAAAAFLRGRLASAAGEAVPGPETRPLALAGYSFGSIQVARAAAGDVPVKALVLIAFLPDWPELPPDTYSRLETFSGPVLAIAGEHDDLGRPLEVERTLKRLGLDYTLVVIEGTGHFFEGRQSEVGRRAAEFLSKKLALERYARD